MTSQHRFDNRKSVYSSGSYFSQLNILLLPSLTISPCSLFRRYVYVPSARSMAILPSPTQLLTSLLIIGYPYRLITSSNRISGRKTDTLSNVRTKWSISGYSKPVSTKAASTTGYISRTRCKSTVLSFPPEKLAYTPFSPNSRTHSRIRCCVILTLTDSGMD